MAILAVSCETHIRGIYELNFFNKYVFGGEGWRFMSRGLCTCVCFSVCICICVSPYLCVLQGIHKYNPHHILFFAVCVSVYACMCLLEEPLHYYIINIQVTSYPASPPDTVVFTRVPSSPTVSKVRRNLEICGEWWESCFFFVTRVGGGWGL